MKGKTLVFALVFSLLINVVFIYSLYAKDKKIEDANLTLLSLANSRIDSFSITILEQERENWNREFEITISLDNALDAIGHFAIVGQDSGWLSSDELHLIWDFYRFIENSPLKAGEKYHKLNDSERLQIVELAQILNKIQWTSKNNMNEFLGAIESISGSD